MLDPLLLDEKRGIAVAEFDEVSRPEITHVWVTAPGDARKVTTAAVADSVTRPRFVIYQVVVVLAGLALTVAYRELWWLIAAVGYIALLIALIFWSTSRRLRDPYRPGAKWGMGADEQCFRIAEGRTEGLYRYSSVASVEESRGLVIVKIVRGQRVAWPREVFGDELLAQIRRRVDPR
ncbi:YcxB family protein [Gordonia sp. CPCC 205333]|uniref:YcxB family protein n=1 Tax=Gordonia sp. CPCC 205333 TaxID=3140790 RepID=UPI003AF335D1